VRNKLILQSACLTKAYEDERREEERRGEAKLHFCLSLDQLPGNSNQFSLGRCPWSQTIFMASSTKCHAEQHLTACPLFQGIPCSAL